MNKQDAIKEINILNRKIADKRHKNTLLMRKRVEELSERFNITYGDVLTYNELPDSNIDKERMFRKLKIGKDISPHKCEVCGSSFETPCALAKHQHLFCTGGF